jgi:hypothetical protein
MLIETNLKISVGQIEECFDYFKKIGEQSWLMSTKLNKEFAYLLNFVSLTFKRNLACIHFMCSL